MAAITTVNVSNITINKTKGITTTTICRCLGRCLGRLVIFNERNVCSVCGSIALAASTSDFHQFQDILLIRLVSYRIIMVLYVNVQQGN